MTTLQSRWRAKRTQSHLRKNWLSSWRVSTRSSRYTQHKKRNCLWRWPSSQGPTTCTKSETSSVKRRIETSRQRTKSNKRGLFTWSIQCRGTSMKLGPRKLNLSMWAMRKRITPNQTNTLVRAWVVQWLKSVNRIRVLWGTTRLRKTWDLQRYNTLLDIRVQRCLNDLTRISNQFKRLCSLSDLLFSHQSQK